MLIIVPFFYDIYKGDTLKNGYFSNFFTTYFTEHFLMQD